MLDKSKFGSVVLQDPINNQAGKVPARREHPNFGYAVFFGTDDEPNEVIIYRDGEKALRWMTHLTGDALYDTIAEMIQRMKNQFMGKPRVAEAYL